jgi:hypothetical protein
MAARDLEDRDDMTLPDDVFDVGQPVWVVQRDGSERPAEYVGQGPDEFDAGKAFVIFVDAPSRAFVEFDRLRPR